MSSEISNRHIYRLIRINNKYIHENMGIPREQFDEYEFDFDKIIEENKDSLFYHPTYLTENTHKYFNKVFNKYKKFILKIFKPKKSQITTMESWIVDLNAKSWKSKIPHSTLRNLMLDTKYEFIHPRKFFSLYTEILRVFKETNSQQDETIKRTYLEENLKKKLDHIATEHAIHLEDFKNKMETSTKKYVLSIPINSANIVIESNKTLINQYVENITNIFLETTVKLMEIDVYSIHFDLINTIEEYVDHFHVFEEAEDYVLV